MSPVHGERGATEPTPFPVRVGEVAARSRGPEPGTGWTGRAVLIGALAFLYLPIFALALYSFNDSRFALAWEGFTLEWYARLFANPEIGRALRNTLIVAALSTAVSTAVGSGLAIGLHFSRFRGRRVLQQGLYLPILVPDIIQAVGLLALFALVALPLGLTSIVLGHISFQISFVFLLVRARLDAFPGHLVEAARDLGASPGAAVRRIVLPLAAPGIIAGGIIAFTLSVDDFLIAYFTAGAGASTLPIRIYSMIRRGVTPEVNALATLLLLFSLLTISGAIFLLRGRGGSPGGTPGVSSSEPAPASAAPYTSA